MYIFKFNDNRKDEVIEGNFLLEYAQQLWNKGIKFIIVSHYSKTIKVPRRVDYNDYNENLVDFDEFDFDCLLN